MKRICETCKWCDDKTCINVNTLMGLPELKRQKLYDVKDSSCSNWKPKKRETCEECEFCDKDTWNCQASLPAVIFDSFDNEYNTVFPTVSPIESCGEWMPKDEP